MAKRASVAIVFVFLPLLAFAQIPTVPRYIGQGMFTYQGRSPIDILTQHQTSGDWNTLQAYARELLKDLEKDVQFKDLLGNINDDYYHFVWESKNPDGKAVVNRVLVQMKLKPQHAARLPGIAYDDPSPLTEEELSKAAKQPPPSEPQEPTKGGVPPKPTVDSQGPQLFDILLSPAAAASLSSVYVSTPAVNPALAQLPDVVARTNVLGFAAAALGTADSAAQIRVYINQPILPVSRAGIKIKDTIATRVPSIILLGEINKTYEAVLTRQARTSPCAVSLVKALKEDLNTASGQDDCKIASVGCATLIKTTIATTYATTTKACAAETLQPVGFDPVVAVEQEFSKLVATASPKETTGEFTLNNTPLTHYSFGLMTGYLIGHTSLSEARVKMDGGKIANAPLNRLLTMVVLNVHPWPYDAEWNKMSREESFRLFGGTVITPDFGFTAGFGFGLVRGLALNAGGIILLSDVVKAGEQVGSEPKDKNDPFRTLPGVGGFVGFSYTFK